MEHVVGLIKLYRKMMEQNSVVVIERFLVVENAVSGKTARTHLRVQLVLHALHNLEKKALPNGIQCVIMYFANIQDLYDVIAIQVLTATQKQEKGVFLLPSAIQKYVVLKDTNGMPASVVQSVEPEKMGVDSLDAANKAKKYAEMENVEEYVKIVPIKEDRTSKAAILVKLVVRVVVAISKEEANVVLLVRRWLIYVLIINFVVEAQIVVKTMKFVVEILLILLIYNV
jgi:hypothetical protein